jgi:MerR family mercuric resistance operon transcriptional regulator
MKSAIFSGVIEPDSSFTIGQLARVAGVPVSTVRFYERRGLLKPDARTGSNYRAYSARTAERLKFIRAAQATGFSLKDIREMLALTDTQGPPCDEVAALIQHRLDDVKQRLRELRRVDRTLSLALKSCCRGGADWCNEIERLKHGTPTACTVPPKSRPKPLTLH